MPDNDIAKRWYTVAEVAQMLDFGLSKTKMLVAAGEIRSVKDGRHRRILPESVDEYVARRVAQSEAHDGAETGPLERGRVDFPLPQRLRCLRLGHDPIRNTATQVGLREDPR